MRRTFNGGDHNKKHWKVTIATRERHAIAQQIFLNWRKNWRNGLTRRERLVLEFPPQLSVWKQNRWQKPETLFRVTCWEWSFGTLVSSLHGSTWLVGSPKNDNFTKTTWELWRETSEISSFYYWWAKEAQVWALADWNADQTLLKFDMPANYTVDSKGKKTVSIMTTSHEKDRFTVMLACLGNGTKLPPYVMFKQKTLPKDLVLPQGIHVRT